MCAASFPPSDAGLTSAELFCPECGYDLRGIASDRCPECGLAIDRSALSESRLPWSHRRTIGRVRAYWRTNLIAMFRPRRLAAEIARPVSLSDARRFWHVTVLLAWVPAAAWGVGLMLNVLGSDEPSHALSGGLGGWLEIACAAVALVALWLFLLTASGAGSYFYHPRQLSVLRQNRAVALSYYSCAALVWLWVPAAFGALSAAATEPGDRQFKIVFGLLAVACLPIILLFWWIGSVNVMRRTTHCHARRTLALSIFLPAAWLALLAISAGVVLAATYVSMVVMSFR